MTVRDHKILAVEQVDGIPAAGDGYPAHAAARTAFHQVSVVGRVHDVNVLDQYPLAIAERRVTGRGAPRVLIALRMGDSLAFIDQRNSPWLLS
jgi:hypothetical protein